MAHAGERMVPLVLKGKTVQVLGSADQLHSFTYVPDLAAAMIAAARRPDLWNSVLHAPTNPALTQRGLATAYATAAGLPAPKVTAIPGWVVRGAGMVSKDMREVAEMLEVPVRHFLDPRNIETGESREVLGRMWPNETFVFRGHRVFGATARTLRHVLDLAFGGEQAGS